jgi:hypothetical protein
MNFPSARVKLPNRRASASFSFQCGPHCYIATVSYFPNHELAEIFLGNGRAGSDVDAAAKVARSLRVSPCNTACLSMPFGTHYCAIAEGLRHRR